MPEWLWYVFLFVASFASYWIGNKTRTSETHEISETKWIELQKYKINSDESIEKYKIDKEHEINMYLARRGVFDDQNVEAKEGEDE